LKGTRRGEVPRQKEAMKSIISRSFRKGDAQVPGQKAGKSIIHDLSEGAMSQFQDRKQKS
jgi:hypothetical protein